MRPRTVPRAECRRRSSLDVPPSFLASVTTKVETFCGDRRLTFTRPAPIPHLSLHMRVATNDTNLNIGIQQTRHLFDENLHQCSFCICSRHCKRASQTSVAFTALAWALPKSTRQVVQARPNPEIGDVMCELRVHVDEHIYAVRNQTSTVCARFGHLLGPRFLIRDGAVVEHKLVRPQTLPPLLPRAWLPLTRPRDVCRRMSISITLHPGRRTSKRNYFSGPPLSSHNASVDRTALSDDRCPVGARSCAS